MQCYKIIYFNNQFVISSQKNTQKVWNESFHTTYIINFEFLPPKTCMSFGLNPNCLQISSSWKLNMGYFPFSHRKPGPANFRYKNNDFMLNRLIENILEFRKYLRNIIFQKQYFLQRMLWKIALSHFGI